MDAVSLALANDFTKNYVKPRLWNPQGLRRWRASLADALFTQPVITVLGDSLTFGVGSDNLSAGTDEATFVTNGWAAQLRSLFAATYGDPGEGMLLLNQDYRVTTGGSPTGLQSYGPFQGGYDLTSGQSLTIAVPQSTEIDIWYSWTNTVTDPFTYTVDGGASQTAPTQSTVDAFFKLTLTGLTDTTHTLVINGPAALKATISAVTARRGTTGVVVHRFGKWGKTAGYASGAGDPIGTGTMTGDNLTRYLKATFENPATDLAIIEFGINDFNQQDTNLITPSVFATSLTTLINKVTAINGCVLLLMGPRSIPVVKTYTEDQYWAAARALATPGSHVAYLNIADVWGTSTQAHASDVDLQIAASVHPNRRGHGDMARMVHAAITGQGLVQS